MNASPARCSACGADAVVGGVCGRCGTPSGEANRCPHCSAIARVEPKGSGASLTWVCGVCGGPRMPAGAGGEAAMTPLREAKASQSRAARARASFWLFAIMATFFTLVALAAWPAGLIVKLILLTLAITPTAFAVRARARAGRAKGDANEALDRAWLAAAEDVASHAKKGVTVAELASRLKIDPVKAEKLLTQLAVHERTRIDVDDDAEVRYSVAPELDTSRVRVDSTEDQFRALEEAELDEEQAKKLATPAFPRGSGR
ncbi:MAG: hypothetical protein JWP87_1739 [Labilithrix sp.]|nr:hypothetical protein [Labilithrix sp.]